MIESKNTTGPVVLVSKEIMYTFPFGYAYLAGYLREKGIDVRVEFRPEEKKEFKDFVRKIIAIKPVLVGFGTIYPDLYPVKELITIFDEEGRNFPLVVGGQMVSPTPEFAVRVTAADYGVIGEGEIILYELAEALRKGEDTSHVKGLVIRDGDNVVHTGAGKFIEDMADLPAIPYELFPADRWLSIGKFYTGYGDFFLAPMYRFDDRVIPIHGGRGCPYRCNFCYHHNKPRYRPISHMMEEAGMLLERFDANMIEFSDDLVIASPKRARELVEGMKGLGRKVEYSISCRFNIISKMNDGLLDDMKASGCRIMGIGLESGSQKILDVMHKRISVEEIKTGLCRLKKAGIVPVAAFMVGQITETLDDASRSLRLLKDIIEQDRNFACNFSITTPYPGSELYDIAFQKGLIKSHQDFFKKYDPARDMCGVSVNMSEMTDEEVEKMRNELENTYMHEKKKYADPETLKIEKQRTALYNRYNRFQRSFFFRLLGKGVKNVIEKVYERIQRKLDKKRLKAYDIQS